MATFKDLTELIEVVNPEDSDILLIQTNQGARKITYENVLKPTADDIEYNSENSKLQLKSGEDVLSETIINIPEGFSGNYNDLTNKPIIPSSLPANGGNADTVGGKSVSELQNYNNLTNKPIVPTKTSQLTNDSGFSTSSFSGNYNDLTNKPSIPTKTSQLTNDSGFGSIPAGLASGYVRTGYINANEIGEAATIEGKGNYGEGDYSHTENRSNGGFGTVSHAGGYSSMAHGFGSFVHGHTCFAWNEESFALGLGTTAKKDSQLVMGEYNVESTSAIFIIGNGTRTTPSNAFRVESTGQVFGKAAYQSSGADYAEYFEWLDGNIDNEDRRGYFVTLEGKKIRKANSTDDYILGVISANPVIIGNSDPDNWHGKFLKDEFECYLQEETEYEIKLIPDADGNAQTTTKHAQSYIINPEFDKSLDSTYIPRFDRPEWSPVGMLGQLITRDDGTCLVNKYCKPNDQGIATYCDSHGWRVIERISNNLIRIIFK